MSVLKLLCLLKPTLMLIVKIMFLSEKILRSKLKIYIVSNYKMHKIFLLLFVVWSVLSLFLALLFVLNYHCEVQWFVMERCLFNFDTFYLTGLDGNKRYKMCNDESVIKSKNKYYWPLRCFPNDSLNKKRVPRKKKNSLKV